MDSLKPQCLKGLLPVGFSRDGCGHSCFCAIAGRHRCLSVSGVSDMTSLHRGVFKETGGRGQKPHEACLIHDVQ